MKVRNINGTSEFRCDCGNPLDHWKKFSGQPLFSYCAEKSCIKKPEFGALVQKDGSTDKTWYIVPLCPVHNGQTGQSISVIDKIQMVPAAPCGACGGETAST